MVRTQIQLPEGEYEELRTIANRERRSLADWIRESIRWFLQRHRGDLASIEEVAGKFRPTPLPTDLKDHDRWVVEAIENSKHTEPSP